MIINIRDIGSLKYITNEYYLINLYISNIIKEKPLLVYLRREIYIIDDLKIKILIRVNILSFKRILINVGEKKLLIRSYNNLIADIKIKAKNNMKVYRYIRN